MALTPDKISKFWKELKRRRVVHVTVIYISAAVLIIDLINNIAEPLRLPEWTPTLIIVLLAIGFPVALFFSWIFDVTPEGLEKTKPIKDEDAAVVASSDKSSSGGNGWKIATYVSLAVIIGLVMLHLFGGNSPSDELPEDSIAILPVHNLSGDPAQEAMCDGLTREIITQLYKIGSFDKVVAHQTMMTYKKSMKSIPVIAGERGVNYILDPSYRKVGDSLNVSVDLVNALTEEILWHCDFDREYRAIMSLQSEIALGIARQLKVHVSGEEEERIAKRETNNLEAYELVQKTVHNFFGEFNPDFHMRDSLEKAIRLDPDYATPYAVVATFSTFKFAGLGGADFSYKEAISYNRKALSLDPENSAAILNQALFEEWVNWDYVKAGEYFQKGFSVEPNTRFLYLISSYIEFLFKRERYEEIPPYLKRLDEPHKRALQIYTALGLHEKVAELDHGIPKGPQPLWLIEHYVWEERYEEIRKYIESLTLTTENLRKGPSVLAYAALSYQKTGDDSTAFQLVNILKEMSETSEFGMPEFNLGRYYSGIGEVDSAFFWLYRAYEEHCVDMCWLRADKLLKKLDFDDRYWDLYEKTGHKAYDEYRASLPH
jgi:TolB-like protein